MAEISLGTEVVENHVEENGEATQMAGVDQLTKFIGGSVGVVRRIKHHPRRNPRPRVPGDWAMGMNSTAVMPRSRK